MSDFTSLCVTWEGPAAALDSSILGGRVVRYLSGLIAKRKKPDKIVGETGIELTSNAMLT